MLLREEVGHIPDAGVSTPPFPPGHLYRICFVATFTT